jgi:hypothetical protein
MSSQCFNEVCSGRMLTSSISASQFQPVHTACAVIGSLGSWETPDSLNPHSGAGTPGTPGTLGSGPRLSAPTCTSDMQNLSG